MNWKYGIFFHYLAFDYECAAIYSKKDQQISSSSWKQLIEDFDVQTLARQIAMCGFQYAFLTIGQNSGYYLTPNQAYEQLVPRGDDSRLARRDLIADLSSALAEYNIKLLTYLPSGSPGKDSFACEKLGSGAQFRHNWETVIREWSLRWGDSVAGWWFDGVYQPEEYNHEPPNFHTLAEAARAGNPHALISLNHGVHYPSVALSDEEDYAAGETNDPWLAIHSHCHDPKRRPHMLTYAGQFWGIGPFRFSAREMAAITRKFNTFEGPVTWDVPIERSGTLSRETIEILKEFNQIMNEANGSFPLCEPELLQVAEWSNYPQKVKNGIGRLNGELFYYSPVHPQHVLRAGELEREFRLPVKRTLRHKYACSLEDYAEIQLKVNVDRLEFTVRLHDPDAHCGHIRWDGSCFEIRLRAQEHNVCYLFTPDGKVTPKPLEFKFKKDDVGWSISGAVQRMPELEFRASVIRQGRAHYRYLFGGDQPQYCNLAE